MRSEDAKVQLVTKSTYDELVKRYPMFMATVWVRLWKQWHTNYAYVYQCAGSGLASKLNQIESEKVVS